VHYRYHRFQLFGTWLPDAVDDLEIPLSAVRDVRVKTFGALGWLERLNIAPMWTVLELGFSDGSTAYFRRYQAKEWQTAVVRIRNELGLLMESRLTKTNN
jgi:hypothetical protein